MVVIRLSRGGAKHRPFYSVVVADSRRPVSGRFIERVGFYDPKAPAGREALRFSVDRLSYWRGKGAKMTSTVARLYKDFGSKALTAGAGTAQAAGAGTTQAAGAGTTQAAGAGTAPAAA